MLLFQSSASSSSRKPQTLNASSQHPLPPRPDWAINLIPQNSRNMSPISPPRNTSNGSVHPNYSPRHPHSNLQNPSQSADFPPLSTVQPLERRAPAGAWGNSSRPIFGQAPNNGVNNEMQSRLDESGFDRPPPKVCGAISFIHIINKLKKNDFCSLSPQSCIIQRRLNGRL